ncbi:MAG: hypothetical protein JSS72_00740 [Armatimonadetes bacterium]|nr:hypothetical protein [Armatimonadota bacterium]
MSPVLLALIVLNSPLQDSPPAKVKAKPAAASNAPVSVADSSHVFRMVTDALHHVLKLPEPNLPKLTGSNLTAEQAASEFRAIFEYARPKFEFKPLPLEFEERKWTLKSAKAREDARLLVSYGCLAKVGPIVCSKNGLLTAKQFGDAVGMFLGRIAEITHVPSQEFSPYLHGE